MDHVTCTTCGSENKPGLKYCFSCGYELPKPVVTEFVYDNSIELFHKKRKRRNLLIGIAAAIILLSIGYTVIHVIAKPFFTGKVLAVAVDGVNKKCPVMLDEYTRLDSATTLDNHTMMYCYTLIEMELAEVNPDTIKKYLYPEVVKNVKSNNKELKIFKDLGTTFVYNYLDKNGATVLKFSVTPDLYQ